MQVNVIIHPYGSKNNPGNVSPDLRVVEASWTRKIAMYVASKLESSHIHTEFTVNPYDYSTEPSVDFAVQKAEQLKTEDPRSVVILLALRLNSSNDNGKWCRQDSLTVRCDSGEPNSALLAEFISRSYTSYGKHGSPNYFRITKYDNAVWKGKASEDVKRLVEKCRSPHIIPVVCGNYLADRRDAVIYMSSAKGMEEISDAIALGITDFLNNRFGESRNVRFSTSFSFPDISGTEPEKLYSNYEKDE